MSEERAAAIDEDSVEAIDFNQFRSGLPTGAFHVIVNPALAHPFVAQRVQATGVAIALAGGGIVAALAGNLIVGAVLVALATLFRRSIKRRAPQILLHLACHSPTTYAEATSGAVMEVRRR